MGAGLYRPVLGYEAGRVTGASRRLIQLGLRKWRSWPIGLEEPTWVWRLLSLRMREELNHLPERIPGSIRITLLEPNFVGKDSGHHKGPPPGRDEGLLR